MERIAEFLKVSYERWKQDFIETTSVEYIPEDALMTLYDGIEIPKRSTVGSAGYDIKAYFSISLAPGETVKIPTGLRCDINNGWFLQVVPRSGLGFKYRCQLDNTVGIIDQDYFYSSNEGHIFVKITNDTKENKTININPGEGVVQGIFLQYGITVSDNAEGIRDGGFGSTTKKNLPREDVISAIKGMGKQ